MDWIEDLKAAFAKGELCHGGCGDRAERLSVFGKHVGAFCMECWREVAHGQVPRPTRPRARRKP